MSLESIANVLLSPRMTEKATVLADSHRQFVFKVSSSATKIQVRQAVEKLFNVVVKKVNILNVKPKRRHFGRREGMIKGWKKAYVSLEEGYDIEFMDLRS